MNPPILATRNLGLDIGGAKIVADVSLEVAEGELLGIIGPNGAGKTSLFNLFSGRVPAHGRNDRARRAGHHAPADLPAGARGLGRTFQVSSVFPLLTRARERAPRRRGGARGTLRIWRRAHERASPRSQRARCGARAGRARGEARSRRQARSRTATSGGSSSRCCSPPTRP